MAVFPDVNPVEVVSSVSQREACYPLITVMTPLSSHASYIEHAPEFNLELQFEKWQISKKLFSASGGFVEEKKSGKFNN